MAVIGVIKMAILTCVEFGRKITSKAVLWRGSVGISAKVAAFLISSHLIWSAAQANCGTLNENYTMLEKLASLEMARSISESSAPRAALAEARRTNLFIQQQMDLTLLIEGKCPLPAQPLGKNQYLTPALKCLAEEAKRNTSAIECDVSLWARDQ